MSATTDQAASPSTLNGHERCLLCGQMNPWSLGLRFRKEEDLSVVSSFRAHPRLQGYDGILRLVRPSLILAHKPAATTWLHAQ